MRCLEKNPDARFATVSELNQALAHCAQSSVPWSLEHAAELWAVIPTPSDNDGAVSTAGPITTLAVDIDDQFES